MKFKHGDKVLFTEERLMRAQERTLLGSTGTPTPTDEYIMKNFNNEQTVKRSTNLFGKEIVELEDFYGNYYAGSFRLADQPVEKAVYKLDEELFTL